MVREQLDVYLPQANSTVYQKGAYYLGKNFFDNLPREIKNVTDQLTKFKIALKQSCYTLD